MWSPRPGYENRLDVLAARFDGVVSRGTCAAYLTYQDWRRSESKFLLLSILLMVWIPKTGIGVVGGLLAFAGLAIGVTTLTYRYVTGSAAQAAFQNEFGRPPKPLLRAMHRGPNAIAALRNQGS